MKVTPKQKAFFIELNPHKGLDESKITLLFYEDSAVIITHDCLEEHRLDVAWLCHSCHVAEHKQINQNK